MSFLFPLVFFFLAVACLAHAAWTDIRRFEIPNRLSLALVGIFIAGALVPDTLWDGVNALSGLVAGGLTFAVMLVFYLGGAMGAGDTKLAGAVALLVGVAHMGLFLLVMTCFGGVMAAYALMARKYPKIVPRAVPDSIWPGKLRHDTHPLPYGVAIATGGMVALWVKWLEPVFS